MYYFYETRDVYSDNGEIQPVRTASLLTTVDTVIHNLNVGNYIIFNETKFKITEINIDLEEAKPVTIVYVVQV